MMKVPAGIALLIAAALPLAVGFRVQEAANWPWPAGYGKSNDSTFKEFVIPDKTVNGLIVTEPAGVARLSEHIMNKNKPITVAIEE